MISEPLLDAAVDRALLEDLASGDITTEASVPATARGVARAVAKSPLVLSGGDVFARVFYRVDRGLRVERHLSDGEHAEPGRPLLSVEGSTRSILMAERTALNFLQRMSGIATFTATFVSAVPP